MGIIKSEDVRAIYVKGTVACPDCATQEEWNIVNTATGGIIMHKDNDKEDFYFCDRCQKRI